MGTLRLSPTVFRVLVMDDDPSLERKYKSLFQNPILKVSYELCDFVWDEDRAFSRAHLHNPDIAVLDVRSENNNQAGIKTARRLLILNEEIHIILCTSTDYASWKLACQAAKEGFEFVRKEDFFQTTRARLMLDSVLAGVHLAWPDSVRALIADQLLTEDEEKITQIDIPDYEVRFPPLPPNARKVWLLIAENPKFTEKYIANMLGWDPMRGQDAVHYQIRTVKGKLRKFFPKYAAELEPFPDGRILAVRLLKSIEAL